MTEFEKLELRIENTERTLLTINNLLELHLYLPKDLTTKLNTLMKLYLDANAELGSKVTVHVREVL